MDAKQCGLHTVAIGGTLHRLTGLIDLIREIDVTKLPALFDAINELHDAGTTRGKIDAALNLMVALANATHNTADDEWATWVESIMSDPIRDLIATIIENLFGGLEFSAEADKLSDEASAAGIDIGMIWQIIQIILEILRSIQG